jgi:hypothetical protein
MKGNGMQKMVHIFSRHLLGDAVRHVDLWQRKWNYPILLIPCLRLGKLRAFRALRGDLNCSV